MQHSCTLRAFAPFCTLRACHAAFASFSNLFACLSPLPTLLHLQVGLAIFLESRKDNGLEFLTLYKSPNAAIVAVPKIPAGKLILVPSTRSVSLTNNNSYGVIVQEGETRTPVYLGKDLQFPREENAKTFLPPFGFVEYSKEAALWDHRERKEWEGQRTGVETRGDRRRQT